jgi:hypothetical protein
MLYEGILIPVRPRSNGCPKGTPQVPGSWNRLQSMTLSSIADCIAERPMFLQYACRPYNKCALVHHESIPKMAIPNSRRLVRQFFVVDQVSAVEETLLLQLQICPDAEVVILSVFVETCECLLWLALPVICNVTLLK